MNEQTNNPNKNNPEAIKIETVKIVIKKLEENAKSWMVNQIDGPNSKYNVEINKRIKTAERSNKILSFKDTKDQVFEDHKHEIMLKYPDAVDALPQIFAENKITILKSKEFHNLFQNQILHELINIKRNKDTEKFADRLYILKLIDIAVANTTKNIWKSDISIQQRARKIINEYSKTKEITDSKKIANLAINQALNEKLPEILYSNTEYSSDFGEIFKLHSDIIESSPDSMKSSVKFIPIFGKFIEERETNKMNQDKANRLKEEQLEKEKEYKKQLENDKNRKFASFATKTIKTNNASNFKATQESQKAPQEQNSLEFTTNQDLPKHSPKEFMPQEELSINIKELPGYQEFVTYLRESNKNSPVKFLNSFKKATHFVVSTSDSQNYKNVLAELKEVSNDFLNFVWKKLNTYHFVNETGEDFSLDDMLKLVYRSTYGQKTWKKNLGIENVYDQVFDSCLEKFEIVFEDLFTMLDSSNYPGGEKLYSPNDKNFLIVNLFLAYATSDKFKNTKNSFIMRQLVNGVNLSAIAKSKEKEQSNVFSKFNNFFKSKK